MLNTFPVVAVCVNVCTRTQHRRGDKKEPKRDQKKRSAPELPMLSTKIPVSNQDQTPYGMSRVINASGLLYCTNRYIFHRSAYVTSYSCSTALSPA